MANTSASGGFLSGTAVNSPVNKVELENIFHALICGLTGLEKKLVRPRYQPKGGKIPPAGVNWCAFGLTQSASPAPEVTHNGQGQGHSTLAVQRSLELLISFYGPGAFDLAQATQDGLSISQNRALLRQHQIGFTRFGPLVPVPGQAEFGWLDRQDLTLFFTARQARNYAVLNITSAETLITKD